MPLHWFETAKTGDVLARLNADTAVVQTVLASTVSMAVRNLILLVGGLVLVVLSSAKMSVVVAAVVPVVVIPLVLLARRLRAASRSAQDALGEVSAEAEEALSGIRTVMAFAQSQQVLTRLKDVCIWPLVRPCRGCGCERPCPGLCCLWWLPVWR